MATQTATRKTAQNVTKFSDFDATKLSFSKIRSMDNGGRMAYLNYSGRPLYLQTPEMIVPGGVGAWKNDDRTAYDMRLSFGNLEGDLGVFHQKMSEMDDYIRNYIRQEENCMEWAECEPDELTDAMLRKMYTTVVKKSMDKKTKKPDGKYPDSMKIKLPFRVNEDGETEFLCSIFDADTRQLVADVPPDVYITKGSRVTAIVQCTGVWLVGGGIHPTFKLKQAKVSRSDASLGQGYAFLDDNEILPDTQQFTSVSQFGDTANVPPAQESTPPSMGNIELADDSDGVSVGDDDNVSVSSAESEPEPEPEPEKKAPASRTRASRRRKASKK
jgi:hypothetical protein